MMCSSLSGRCDVNGVSVCLSVYSGHQSILVPPLELESNASLWLSAVSQYKVRVTFCSYSVMEMCTKGLGSQTEALRVSVTHIHTLQVFCVCVDVQFVHVMCAVEERESVVCEDVYGGGRRASSHRSRSILLKDLQRSGTVRSSRQHDLRLSG